ncbi:ankyrin [Polyplosphaeria fusca]|uniref:Ankyrin n=1 Tax=Polyplosphaeria fusca TaxID=682080 RepID=A0A9P4QIL2_9PLEO|nr:ankyrin [Polyplosphaeria fusca]
MTKDWDSVRHDIKDLSVNQKKCLQDVKSIMETKYKFKASTRAYRGKLKEWGYLRYKPRKATKDRSNRSRRQESEDDDDSENAEEVMMDVDEAEDVDMSPTEGPERGSTLLQEAESLITTVDPWAQARNATTDALMEMLGAILDGDSNRLEQAIVKNPNYINYPIGLPFQAHGGRYFNHPAVQQCVILQHEEQTLLDVACGLPSGPVIWVLLAHNAKSSRHPLGTDLAFHNAIKNGRCFTVQSLIHSGLSNVNGVPGIPWKPLIQAVYWRVPDVVRVLLDKGATVNDSVPWQEGDNETSRTALQLALDRRARDYADISIRERCEKMIRMLLKAGANINLPDQPTPFELFLRPWQGDTLWVTKLGPIDIECLELFVDKGADLQTSFRGFPCGASSAQNFEHQVLWHSTPQTARLVVDHADPTPEANGSNLLHEVTGCCPDAKRHPAETLRDIEVLFKRGADPNLADANGLTPLRRCIERCPALDILPRLQALLDAGADPELRDHNGAFPITLAARIFDDPLKTQVMELLLSKFRGVQPSIHHDIPALWVPGYFPIPEHPTAEQVLCYSHQNGDFECHLQRMIPDDVHDVFQKAAFSIASKNFLTSQTEKVTRHQHRLTATEKVEIHHIVTMRKTCVLPEYKFEEAFVMSLLMPSSTPALINDFSSMTLPNSAPSLPLSALPPSISLDPNLPTPLPIPTPPANPPSRRSSASSTSSTFVPTTTQIRWPVGRATRPGDDERAKTKVLKFRCKSCKHEPLLTGAEYRRHEDEHWHSLGCKEGEGCGRRFCVASR